MCVKGSVIDSSLNLCLRVDCFSKVNECAMKFLYSNVNPKLLPLNLLKSLFSVFEIHIKCIILLLLGCTLQVVLKLEVLQFEDTEVTTAVRNCQSKLMQTSRICEFRVFQRQMQIVLECERSMGLGQFSSPQRRATFYMLLAYIETESPGLISFEMRGGIETA